MSQEILVKRPSINLVYAADNAFFPYGKLSITELKQRVLSQMDELINLYAPDIAVIACNTASTSLLADLRGVFDIPFVGVVPAVKPAAAATHTGHIAVLATSATVNRDYTKGLVREFAGGRTVILHDAQELVAAAENYILQGTAPDHAVAETFTRLYASPESTRIDTIVLACTHFPLIRGAIERQLVRHPSAQLLDSGEAIARRVDSLLPPTPPDSPQGSISIHLSLVNATTSTAYYSYLSA